MTTAGVPGVIQEVVLRGLSAANQKRLLAYALSCLRRELRCESIVTRARVDLPEVRVALGNWQYCDADLLNFDRLLQSLENEGYFRLILTTPDWLEGTQSAFELLNRYQRLLPLPSGLKPIPQLTQVLAAHSSLFVRDLPAARVGRDHGLDVWRWVLRLSAQTSMPLELAALFCDVEAPLPQAQLARGSLALDARARLGSARVACQALEPIGLSQHELLRMAELILNVDHPNLDRELATLRDARDLSFFSLSSWNFLRIQGIEATREKVARLLSRMSEAAICLSLMTRQHPDVARAIEDFFDTEAAPDSGVRAT
jgi:hypothetical protein